MKTRFPLTIATMALSLAFSASSFGAITSSNDCSDGNGARVQWEVRPSGELARGIHLEIDGQSINLNASQLETSFSGDQSTLKAQTEDGQTVNIQAGILIRDEGDIREYLGTMEVLVRGKTGEVKRSAGTVVRCQVYGEG